MRRLLANWELKLLSVVIAFALWLLVVGSGKSQLAVAAVVEYTGLDSDLVLVGRPRDTAEVELEAARWAVGRLTPGAVRVRVNLAGTREGENVVALSPAPVQAPGHLARPLWRSAPRGKDPRHAPSWPLRPCQLCRPFLHADRNCRAHRFGVIRREPQSPGVAHHET